MQQAEAYRASLAGPAQAARALVDQLPATTRRVYGHGAVLALVIPEAQVFTGITLAGEREELPGTQRRSDGLIAPVGERLEVPDITTNAATFLDWVRGEVPHGSMSTVPTWATRNVGTALGSVLKTLKNNPIPAPPPLRPL